VNIIQMQDEVDFRDYQTELKYLVSNDERMIAIAKEIAQVNRTGNTLVLVDRIEAGEKLLANLTNYNTLKDDVVFVSGGTKSTKRIEQYADVATATNKIIIATYGVAAVGINIPRLFNVVLIEPGKSFVRTIQSIGRGLRMASDKDFVQITDITSSCKFSKRHLTQRKAFYKEAAYPFDVTKVKYKP
jgi:superfamily II DNA or RNA helicase